MVEHRPITTQTSETAASSTAAPNLSITHWTDPVCKKSRSIYGPNADIFFRMTKRRRRRRYKNMSLTIKIQHSVLRCKLPKHPKRIATSNMSLIMDGNATLSASTTVSLSASILEFRTFHGRTYHSLQGTAEHW